MEIIEVERLANQVGMPVIRNPERNFPGVLIQGDALAILYWRIEELHKLHVDSLPEDDQRRIASKQVIDMVGRYVIAYETALMEHDIRLPYNATMTASAWQSHK